MSHAFYHRALRPAEVPSNRTTLMYKGTSSSGERPIEYYEEYAGENLTHRPKLRELLLNALSGKHKFIFVPSLDHLSRSPIIALPILKQLSEKHITVQSLSPDEQVTQDQSWFNRTGWLITAWLKRYHAYQTAQGMRVPRKPKICIACKKHHLGRPPKECLHYKQELHIAKQQGRTTTKNPLNTNKPHSDEETTQAYLAEGGGLL